MSKANKENEPYPAEKYPINTLWNSQKNTCRENKRNIAIHKMTSLLPSTARVVLGDRGNTWQLQSNFSHQGIHKSFDYGLIKKENANPELSKIKTEMFESKPTEQSFSYLDDDFNLDSEETNDAEEEYENVEERVDGFENYLKEPVVFNKKIPSSKVLNTVVFNKRFPSPKALNTVVFNKKILPPKALNISVKLSSHNVCEKSEEQMELEEAYTRVNGQTKHLLHCVCNPKVPPSWILSTFLR